MSALSAQNGWNKFWSNLFNSNQKYNQLLIESVYDGDISDARQALLNGADPNYSNSTGITPLHIAAWAEPPIAVSEMLIECGANVNRMDDNGNTPLHFAAQFDNLPLASLLLANRANVNAINYYGYSPMDYATTFDNYDIVRILILNGAMPSILVDEFLIYETPYITMPYDIIDTMVFTSFFEPDPIYDYEIEVITTTYQPPEIYEYEVTTTTTTWEIPQYQVSPTTMVTPVYPTYDSDLVYVQYPYDPGYGGYVDYTTVYDPGYMSPVPPPMSVPTPGGYDSEFVYIQPYPYDPGYSYNSQYLDNVQVPYEFPMTYY